MGEEGGVEEGEVRVASRARQERRARTHLIIFLVLLVIVPHVRAPGDLVARARAEKGEEEKGARGK